MSTTPPETPPESNEEQPDSPFGELTSEEKTLGMVCHLLAFAGCIVPLGNIIGPLVIWLVKKDTSPFVDDQGKESLNFQITATIAFFVLIPIGIIIVCIGWLLLFAVSIAVIILVILASVSASNGTPYRYPLTFRFIK